MGRCIVKIPHDGKDYYMEWSSIVDAPVTYGMPLEEFEEFFEVEYGKAYMRDEHTGRMKRVEEKGISSHMYDSVDDLIGYNRAGPDESMLNKEEIIEKYIVNRGKNV